MALNVIETQIPHVYRIDLDDDGRAHECAVVKQDQFGNIYYLKIADLDAMDRERLGKILHNRFVKELPLWDVMSQTTLKNGINALEYFHQLVKAISPDGNSFIPRAGQTGYSVNQTMAGHEAQQKAVAAHEAAKAAEAAEDAK